MHLLKETSLLKQHGEDCPCCANPHRRRFLAHAGVTAAGILLPPALIAAPNKERMLVMTNPHTGETIRNVYWTPREKYIPESLAIISYFMRDFRRNQVKEIDPKLLDILYAVSQKIGKHRTLEIISGYRSPQTNRTLAQKSRNVAKKSYHMRAQALDFQVKNISSKSLRRIALGLKKGGVGYYPNNRYIHIDSGSVRSWTYS